MSLLGSAGETNKFAPAGPPLTSVFGVLGLHCWLVVAARSSVSDSARVRGVACRLHFWTGKGGAVASGGAATAERYS